MEQYFFLITASYSHKNKLHEAFSNYIHTLDHTLIKDDAALEAFVAIIKKELERLNKEFSRCQPIVLRDIKEGYHSLNPDARTVGYRVEGSWHASLYRVKGAVEIVDGFLQTFIK